MAVGAAATEVARHHNTKGPWAVAPCTMSAGGRGELPDGLAQNGLHVGRPTSIDWAVAAWADRNDPHNRHGRKSGHGVGGLGGEGGRGRTFGS